MFPWDKINLCVYGQELFALFQLSKTYSIVQNLKDTDRNRDTTESDNPEGHV